MTLRRFVLLLCSLLCLSLLADNAPKPGVLFHHTFRSLEADYAGGNPVPTKTVGVALVDGHQGKGAVQTCVGALTFETRGNINPQAGTVAFWVKGENWDGAEQIFHWFFTAGRHTPPNGRHLMFYRYFNMSLLLLARNTDVKGQFDFYSVDKFHLWKRGEWHHLAFSWCKQTQETVIYCDGVPCKAKYNDLMFPDTIEQLGPEMCFNRISVNDYCKMDERTIIDDIYIFDRAIGESGVAELLAEGQKSSAPEFTLPFTSKPPVLDGAITPGEYDTFFSTNTFVEDARQGIYAREARVYAAYDRENIYVTFETALKGDDLNIEMVAALKKRDTDIWLDDACEIIFRPPNTSNVHLAVNSIGTIYDARNGDRSFDGDYEIANALQNRWWVCEMRIPFASLGVEPPATGDAWRILFARDWKNPYICSSLADNTDFHDVEATPTWTFGDEAGTGCLRLDIEAMQSQRVRLQGKFFAGADSATDFIASVFAVTRSGSREMMVEKSVQVAAGQSGELTLECAMDKLDPAKYQNKIGFSLLRGDGVKLQDSEYILKSYPPMTMNASMASIREAFHCTVDISGLPVDLSTIRMEYTLSENGEMKRQWTVDQPAQRVNAFDIQPSQWSPEVKCRLTARAVNRESGALIMEKLLDFSVPERPFWAGTDVGAEHTAPIPWTPMSRKDARIFMWNKEYCLAQTALPASLVSAGEELLAEPVKLQLMDGNGQPVELAELTFPEEDYDDVVYFSARGECGDFSVQLDGRAEFDGFTWYDLAVTPKHEGAAIGPMTLEYVVPRSQFNYLLVNPYGTAYADLYEPEKTPAALPLIRQLLYGNDCRSVAFAIESDEFFRPDTRETCIRHTLDQDAVRCSVDFITETSSLDRTFHYRFGFQTSPLKPMRKDFLNWINNLGYLGKYNKEINLCQIWSWSRWYGFLRPIDEEHFNTDIRNISKRETHSYVQPYFCTYILSMVCPEFPTYGEEWARQPYCEIMEFGPDYPGKSVVACLNAEGYRDFWLANLDQFLDKHSEINGWYWDSIDPNNCMNELHGCGWVDSKGERHQVNNVVAYREFYKRAYRMLKKRHPDSVITGHASGRRFLASVGFCDIITGGEQLVSQLNGDPIFCKWVSDSYARAYAGPQYGMPLMVCPCYYNNEAEVRACRLPTESYHMCSLIYGFLPWSHRVNESVTDEIFDITRSFRLGDAEFIPHYDPRHSTLAAVTASKGADIRSAIYLKEDGKMLLIVGNFGTGAKKVSVRFTQPGQVVERRSGKKLSPAKNGSMTVSIPEYNFIIIEK